MFSLYSFILYLLIIYIFIRFFIFLYKKDKVSKNASSAYLLSYTMVVLILFMPYLGFWGYFGDILSDSKIKPIKITGTALIAGAYVGSICSIFFIFITFILTLLALLKDGITPTPTNKEVDDHSS